MTRSGPTTSADATATRRGRVIVLGPVPPPLYGVAISTSLVLANGSLRERFDVEHVDTSDHRPARNFGRWDVPNVALGLLSLVRLAIATRRTSGRDVVYLNLSQGQSALLRDYLYIWCASLRGWRVAAHLRGSEFGHYVARRGPLFRWLTARSLERVDSMAVLSPRLRSVFAGHLPPERIAVVPNGTLDPGPGDLADDGRTVLFLSNLLRRKGLLESIEAAHLVLDRVPAARFVFAGAFADAELRRIIGDRCKGEHRIEIRPPLSGESKREALLSAAVFLFPPAEPEGHPRALLEALAAGRAIVTTDRGAISETVRDGESAFVLANPVPQELADRIVRLLEDPGLRTRMMHAARSRYLSAFTQDQADAAFVDWISTVAGHAAPHPASGRSDAAPRAEAGPAPA